MERLPRDSAGSPAALLPTSAQVNACAECSCKNINLDPPPNHPMECELRKEWERQWLAARQAAGDPLKLEVEIFGGLAGGLTSTKTKRGKP